MYWADRRWCSYLLKILHQKIIDKGDNSMNIVDIYTQIKMKNK